MNLQGPLFRYLGLFEYEISGHIRDFCSPGRICWDVGGADGYYSLIFQKLTGQTVVSFEGDPEACRALKRTGAEVHQAWVGSGNGNLALDDVQSPPPDVLKIDIEGGEYQALLGARRLLTEQHPALVIEVHSKQLEDQCVELLLGHGYRPTVLSQRRYYREHRANPQNRWLVASGH